MIVIRLPYPAPELFPNRKNGTHYRATSAIKQKQNSDAYFATKAAGAYVAPDGYIPITCLFLAPDNRRRDGDNMLAAAKALLDGMAQALGVDDSRFKPISVDWARGPDKVGALIVGVGVQIVSAVDIGKLPTK